MTDALGVAEHVQDRAASWKGVARVVEKLARAVAGTHSVRDVGGARFVGREAVAANADIVQAVTVLSAAVTNITNDVRAVGSTASGSYSRGTLRGPLRRAARGARSGANI